MSRLGLFAHAPSLRACTELLDLLGVPGPQPEEIAPTWERVRLSLGSGGHLTLSGGRNSNASDPPRLVAWCVEAAAPQRHATGGHTPTGGWGQLPTEPLWVATGPGITTLVPLITALSPVEDAELVLEHFSIRSPADDGLRNLIAAVAGDVRTRTSGPDLVAVVRGPAASVELSS